MELYNNSNHYVLYTNNNEPLTIINQNQSINTLYIDNYIKNDDNINKLVYNNLYISNIIINNKKYKYTSNYAILCVSPNYTTILNNYNIYNVLLHYDNNMEFIINRNNDNDNELNGIIFYYKDNKNDSKETSFNFINIPFEEEI